MFHTSERASPIWCGNVSGFIAGIGSWGQILESCQVSHAVISRLDSDPRPARSVALQRLLNKTAISYDTVNDLLIVRSDDLVRLLSKKGLFVGFDELWLHPCLPSREEICAFPITSDGINLAEDIPHDLIDAFRDSSATTGLGDGCGINFITKHKSVADMIHEGLGGHQI